MNTLGIEIEKTVEKDNRLIIGKGLKYKLYLQNDNYNTFNHVISSIVKILGYSWEQAEQLAIIAHIKGESLMKESNDKEELIAIKNAFRIQNINTKIR